MVNMIEQAPLEQVPPELDNAKAINLHLRLTLSSINSVPVSPTRIPIDRTTYIRDKLACAKLQRC